MKTLAVPCLALLFTACSAGQTGSTVVPLGATAPGSMYRTADGQPTVTRVWMEHSYGIAGSPNDILVYDPTSRTIAKDLSLNWDNSVPFVVSPDLSHLYVEVSATNGDTVVGIAAKTYAASNFHEPPGNAVLAMVGSPDGRFLYAGGYGHTYKINAATHALVRTGSTALEGGQTTDTQTAVVSPDGRFIYNVAQTKINEAEINVIDASSLALVSKFAVGAQPIAVALSADGKTLYVLGAANNQGVLSFVDTATHRLAHRTEIANFPDTIASDPALHRLYVTTGGSVAIVSTTSGALIHTIATSGTPIIGIDSVSHDLWIAENDNTLRKVNATTYATTKYSDPHLSGIASLAITH